MSGNAVAWYHENEWSCLHPFRCLIFKHLGSVIGGSFMTGFFTIGDYFFDLVKPEPFEDPESLHVRFFDQSCQPCYKVFDLVRSDAMALINLTGNPFCNAARYC